MLTSDAEKAHSGRCAGRWREGGDALSNRHSQPGQTQCCADACPARGPWDRTRGGAPGTQGVTFSLLSTHCVTLCDAQMPMLSVDLDSWTIGSVYVDPYWPP